MKAGTPIIANKTLLDGQLHSSGPKMIRYISLMKYHPHNIYSEPGLYTTLNTWLGLVTEKKSNL